MNINKVSIIGRGDFAKLIKDILPRRVVCNLYGSQDTAANLPSIGASDVVILSIPLDSYNQVLPELQKHLDPNTLVIDVCSVKVAPAQLIRKILSGHQNLLITHPLFGPQSYYKSKGNVLVVTEQSGEKAQTVLNFCKDKLKMNILKLTNEEHDKRMSEVHALTFFIARGLSELNLHHEPFMTPSFQKLLDLVELDKSQTEALFLTIQNGNPYGKEERQKFIDKLTKINDGLK